jgi:serine/threonine protein kinase
MQTRKRGGALLGRGVHGTVYNAGKTRKRPTLYSMLKKKDIESIRLTTAHGDINVDNIVEFIEKIGTLEHKIAKIMNEPAFYKGYSIEEDYRNEIALNHKIVQGFGKKAYMLASKPIDSLYKEPVYGVIIKYINGMDYIIFGHKCEPIKTLHVKKFLIDCLEELAVLHDMGYIHSDIKHDNMIYCKQRYTIIDFGIAIPKTKKSLGGSQFFVNPIRLYTDNFPRIFIKPFIMQKVKARLDPAYKRILEPYIDKSLTELDELRAKYDKNTLNNKYKFNYDIFQLGRTLQYLLYKFRMKNPKYTMYVDRLTSLLNPFYTAKEALEWVRKH